MVKLKTPASLPLFDTQPDQSPEQLAQPKQPQHPTTPVIESRTPARAALWLAIYLPRISLEAVVEDHAQRPVATFVRDKGRERIHTASQLAHRGGVKKGMLLSAAYAICPQLQLRPIDRVVQKKRLYQLALLMQQFTSQVTLCAGNALLLEVQRSIAYFGSLEAIQTGVAQQLSQRQHAFYMAVSPTPAASLLLARTGSTNNVCERQDLRSALGGIPTDYLPMNARERQRLHNSGVRELRDIWRLPKDQLGKRFGPGFLLYLDKLLGEAADVRETFRRKPRFCRSEELMHEVSDLDQLGQAAHALLEELGDFLRARDLGVNRVKLRLFHERSNATSIITGTRTATHDVDRLFALLQVRLQQLELPAPVVSVELSATRFFPCRYHNAQLLAPAGRNGEEQGSAQALFEQLQARLGDRAIFAVTAPADFRPERASQLVTAAAPAQNKIDQPRPLWLLPQAEALDVKDVALLSGPERVEQGWWDQHDVRRDYYIARDSYGRLCWVYRDLHQPQQWYLHGLFG
ncbi:MAG: DNA polymerase Y family protein [Pseudomonadota bacterium]